ncbi:hypothetical protein A3844_25015 [Paenibacillus helianthi]|uniref:WYL domain-containing protein n=1 Tax=Paenibacillus helianthi TaxID=1349432 RepID=A0ABX3EIN8_9BACL|nr:hypothetical protein [Paenibacillus helianthi]OKP81849.1 hypothetical protein A3844_25015 [Paenibacillus helianthi]
MSGRIRVLSITPIEYHQRIVRIVNEDTGERREIIYGESVSDRWILRRAPLCWKQATPIKFKGE